VVSKRGGTDIIGGSYLSGNYWSSLDERGFSDTCSDRDGDGICDEPYIVDENNIDYYPLKIVGVSSPSLTPTPTSTLTPTPILMPILVLLAGIGIVVAIIVALVSARER